MVLCLEVIYLQFTFDHTKTQNMRRVIIIFLALFSLVSIQAQPYTLNLVNVSGSTLITCNNPSVNFVVYTNMPNPVSWSWAGPSALSGTNVNISVPGIYTVTAFSSTSLTK